MESFTLADLRSEARLYADMRQAGYLADTSASIDRILNNKLRSVRSYVMNNGGAQLFAKRETWSLVSAQADYACDGAHTTGGTDYALDRLLELHLDWSDSDHERVHECNESAWEQLRQATWAENGRKGWLIREQTVYLSPTPTTTTTVNCVYIPRFTALSASTDAVTGPEGMREVVALEAAIQMRGMADLSTTYLKEQLIDARDQMIQAVKRVAAHDAPRVRDVSPERSYTIYGRNLPDYWDPLPRP